MKNFIKELQKKLAELLLDKSYMLVDKAELEQELDNLKTELQAVQDAKNSVYISEDYIRDAVHDALYNIDINDDCINGLEDVETETAQDMITQLEKKYI